MIPLPTAWPPLLAPQLASHSSGNTSTRFAHDETRLGFLPVVRRRITAGGVPPVATVTDPCDHGSRYGAVEPTTGARFCLALPSRNSRAFHVW